MNTPPASSLERSESGGYPGSIGQGLSREERTAIRRVLVESKEPLHLSQIANKAGIAITNPHKQQNVAQFLQSYLCDTSREAQMHFEPDRRGKDVFKGFVTTDHGKEMVKKGLE